MFSKPENSTDLQVTTQQDPIKAWKIIYLGVNFYTVWLQSSYKSSLVIPIVSKASCENNFYFSNPPRHPNGSPEPKCQCGHYGVENRLILASNQPIAEVDLYGTVIKYEHGYRAQWQRVLSLSIPKGICKGAFLCDEEPQMLKLNKKKNALLQVCRAHNKNAVELSQVSSRLGIEVKWLDIKAT